MNETIDVIGKWTDYISNPKNMRDRMRAHSVRKFHDFIELSSSPTTDLAELRESPVMGIENTVRVLAAILVSEEGMEWEEAKNRVYDVLIDRLSELEQKNIEDINIKCEGIDSE